MEYIFITYIAVTIVLMFINVKVGISAYIVYFFLVPEDLPFLITSTSNVVQLSMFGSLILNSKKQAHKQNSETLKQVLRPFSPLIVMYVLWFLFTFFGELDKFGFDYSYSFKQFQFQIRNFFILPAVMWYVAKIDKNAVKWFNYSFIVAGIVVFIYGLFLLFFNGFNPYILLIANLTNKTIGANMMNEAGEFRLMDRYSSVFMHPMNYGLYLCLFSVYIYSIRQTIGKFLFYLLIGLCVVCLFMSGIRTPIVAFLGGILAYVILIRQAKTVLAFLFFGLIGFYVISQIPELKGTIESIYDSDKELGGSSVDLRLMQLEGCFNEIKTCPFFGKGYEWTTHYYSVSPGGNHPVMYAFESIFIKVLCNSGIIGLIVFVICYYRFTKNTADMTTTWDAHALSWSLVVAFISYCLVTGDYFYLMQFMPFYSIFIINHCRRQVYFQYQKR